MAKVVNDIVKMDWEKSGWLQSKPTKTNPNGVFMMASKDYENENGETISVIFTPGTAFVWGDDIDTDDEELWDAQSLRDWLKKNYDYAFPADYDSYQPIVDIGLSAAKPEILEKYGLMKYKEDIEARVKDIAAYGDETEM